MNRAIARLWSGASQSRLRGANIVVLGIRPNRAETGYGYIEAGKRISRRRSACAALYREAGCEQGGGICGCRKLFLEQRNVLVERAHVSRCATGTSAEDCAPAGGDCGGVRHAQVCEALFGSCIPSAKTSVWITRCWNRARRRVSRQETSFACRRILAGTIWDRGRRLHEHHTAKSSPVDGNLVSGAGVCLMNARGNYIYAPGKFIAAVGVNDLVVVETPDALLITTRQNAQDVGKVVKYLDDKKLHKLT